MRVTESRAAELVVYDGDCGICEASARWIRSRVPGVQVVSHHDHGLERIDAVWFVSSSGKLEGAPAVAAVLRRASSPVFRALGVGIGLPIVRNVAAVVYGLIARNRRRLSSMLGLRACSVEPTSIHDTSDH